jgi:Amt family ammonium transporter
MIWGGGLLAKWGVLDFAGGIVVHASAGMAALASVLYVGKRKVAERGPHSIPLVALGTGLLWFGWYGFNAGSEFRVDNITVAAFLNTDVAASFAGITWLLIAWVLEKKPKFIGLLTGSVAGLATITPAAGYITIGNAAIIGIVSGIVCYFAVALKNKLKWDDALDVWGVHGVGGSIGILMLGLFATNAVNPNVINQGWLIGGSPTFFLTQLVSILLVCTYCFLFTYLMLVIINFITPVKVTVEEEEAGLDSALHGEIAYEQD